MHGPRAQCAVLAAGRDPLAGAVERGAAHAAVLRAQLELSFAAREVPIDGAHAKLLTTCAAGPFAAAAKSTAVNGPLSGRPPGPSTQRITASGKPTAPLPLCSAIT